MHRQVGNATCAPLLFREFEQRRIEGSNAAPAAHGSENPTGESDTEAASPSGRLATFWHPIDADAWRAPSFAAGADAARGARAELEERALRGRLRAGWTRWSTEASVRPAAAWIEDVQHALIGPRGVCSHGRRRWERMGDFRPSHMLERVWLHALDRGLDWLQLVSRWPMRRRGSGVNASRDRDLFIARIRARLEEVVLVCLWSLTGPL